MHRQELLDLLRDETIPADARLARAIDTKALPAAALLQFACDCADRSLELEREAHREPERASFEAIRLVRSWLDQRAQAEPPHVPDKPASSPIFRSIAMADAILKKRHSAQLEQIALEARQTVELWEAKAPALAATTAATVAETAAEAAAAEEDAEREWQTEEKWTDTEIEWAMQAAASRGPGAWAAKSEMDAGAIAKRLVRRQMSAAMHAAREVSRLVADHAAEIALADYERNAPSKPRRSWGEWFRSLWQSNEPAPNSVAPQSQQAEIADAARIAEYTWQISRLGELLPPDP